MPGSHSKEERGGDSAEESPNYTVTEPLVTAGGPLRSLLSYCSWCQQGPGTELLVCGPIAARVDGHQQPWGAWRIALLLLLPMLGGCIPSLQWCLCLGAWRCNSSHCHAYSEH